MWSVRLTAPDWAQMWPSGHTTEGGSSVDTRLNPDVAIRLHRQGKGRGILWVPIGAFWAEAVACTSRGNRNCGGWQGKRPICVPQPCSHCWFPVDHRYFLEETFYWSVTYIQKSTQLNTFSQRQHTRITSPQTKEQNTSHLATPFQSLPPPSTVTTTLMPSTKVYFPVCELRVLARHSLFDVWRLCTTLFAATAFWPCLFLHTLKVGTGT